MKKKITAITSTILLLLLTVPPYWAGRTHGAEQMAEHCKKSPGAIFGAMFVAAAPNMLEAAFDRSDEFYLIKLGVLHGAESRLADCL